MLRSALIVTLCGVFGVALTAQQVADRTYTPVTLTPAFAEAKGPTVLVDEAHQNAMTVDDRLAAFAKLARSDGFRLTVNRQPFTLAALATADILMISNARAEASAGPRDSAFSSTEVEAVRAWVHEGGALLLIADHMPLASAAAKLAEAFGVHFSDAFTMEPFLFELDPDAAVEASYQHPTIFRRQDGTLRSHPITRGRTTAEQVNQVATFTGQAFSGEGLEPLLVMPSGFVSVFPSAPWVFRATDRRQAAEGLVQGAVKRVGAGRAAFFGEAAMFTAQVWGPARVPMGINHPLATGNAQFALNVLRWLAGVE